MRPYEAGKHIRQNKSSRKLVKAIEIADRIVEGDLTFRDAAKMWMGKERAGGASRGRKKKPSKEESSEEESSSEEERVVIKKAPKVSPKQPSRRRETRRSDSQRSTDSNRLPKGQRKESLVQSITARSSRKGSIEQQFQTTIKLPRKYRRNVFTKQVDQEKSVPQPTENGKKMHQESTQQQPAPKDQTMKSKSGQSMPKSSDRKSSGSQAMATQLKKAADTPKVGVRMASQEVTERCKTGISNELSGSGKKNPEKKLVSIKTKKLTESVNNITLSILEETPKDMTPMKSPRIDMPVSPKPRKSDNLKSVKKAEGSTHKPNFSSLKKSAMKTLNTNKSTLRKSSMSKGGKRNGTNDGDNSSYNTEEMEDMMQLMDLQKVNSNVQLKDIIPLRGSNRSISTISASSTPPSICQEPPKQEFLIEADRQQAMVVGETPDDCLSRLSSEQRRHIAQSDMELEKSMEQFQEAERLIQLHGKIPLGFPSLEQRVTEFLRVYKKAEVHKLPPEILLNNNIGTSLNSINQIVKSINSYIPEEHRPILTLLDECCTMLSKMLEDYVGCSLQVFQK